MGTKGAALTFAISWSGIGRHPFTGQERAWPRFVGYLTAFGVLMVWVYDRTQGLLLGMLMHLSSTTGPLVLKPFGIAPMNLPTFSSPRRL